MKPLLIIVILFLSVFSINCKKEENTVTPPTDTPKDIFPLAVGNYWIRLKTVYDTSGVEVASQIDTIKVLRDTVIQNQKCFIVYREGLIQLYNIKTEGLYNVGFDGSLSFQYKYPAVSSDSFYFGTIPTAIKIISIDSSITTPAGNYKCYCYKTNYSNSNVSGNTFELLSPGIGFVFLENYQTFNNSKKYYLYGRIKLLSFNVKGLAG